MFLDDVPAAKPAPVAPVAPGPAPAAAKPKPPPAPKPDTAPVPPPPAPKPVVPDPAPAATIDAGGGSALNISGAAPVEPPPVSDTPPTDDRQAAAYNTMRQAVANGLRTASGNALSPEAALEAVDAILRTPSLASGEHIGPYATEDDYALDLPSGWINYVRSPGGRAAIAELNRLAGSQRARQQALNEARIDQMITDRGGSSSRTTQVRTTPFAADAPTDLNVAPRFMPTPGRAAALALGDATGLNAGEYTQHNFAAVPQTGTPRQANLPGETPGHAAMNEIAAGGYGAPRPGMVGSPARPSVDAATGAVRAQAYADYMDAMREWHGTDRNNLTPRALTELQARVGGAEDALATADPGYAESALYKMLNSGNLSPAQQRVVIDRLRLTAQHNAPKD